MVASLGACFALHPIPTKAVPQERNPPSTQTRQKQMPNNSNNQTILAVQADSRIIFARRPTPEEMAQQKADYDRATMELMAMIPGWFKRPEEEEMEAKKQTSMMDFVRQAKPVDGPER
jgi:hypothetical protein